MSNEPEETWVWDHEFGACHLKVQDCKQCTDQAMDNVRLGSPIAVRVMGFKEVFKSRYHFDPPAEE